MVEIGFLTNENDMENMEVGNRIKLHSYSDWAKVKCSDGKWKLYKGEKDLSVGGLWTYDDIEVFDSNMDVFRVRIGKKWGVINNCGKTLIDCNFDRIESFILGYFIVHENLPSDSSLSYIGIYTKDGTQIFAPTLVDIKIEEDEENIYCYVEDFKGEKSIINLNNIFSLENKSQICSYQNIIRKKYKDRIIFEVVVRHEDGTNTIGFLDEDCCTIIPPIFVVFSYLEDGLYKYRTKYALTGVIRIDESWDVTRYEEYVKYEQLLYENQQQSGTSLSLYQSAMLIPPIYQNVIYKNKFFTAVVKRDSYDFINDGKYDIYDEDGEKILHMSSLKIFDIKMNELSSSFFSYMDKNISHHSIKFELNNRRGLISYSGVIELPPKYDDFEVIKGYYDSSYFRTLRRGKYGLYANNKELYPPICDEIMTETYEHVRGWIQGAVIKQNNLLGIVLHQGSIIHPYYNSIRCDNDLNFIVEQNGKFGIIVIRKKQICSEIIYDSMEFHYGEIYGRLGRKLSVFSPLTTGGFTVKSSFIIEDLTRGYPNKNSKTFLADCENINILTRKPIM